MYKTPQWALCHRLFRNNSSSAYIYIHTQLTIAFLCIGIHAPLISPWETLGKIQQIHHEVCRQLELFRNMFVCFFVPPGIHYCCVDTGNMQWDVIKISAHDWPWESNPRPFDLESLTLSITIHLATCSLELWYTIVTNVIRADLCN